MFTSSEEGPLITGLREALLTTSENPRLSPEIENMFASNAVTGTASSSSDDDSDNTSDESTHNLGTRFQKARALYQRVIDHNHPIEYAVFYKLSEKKDKEAIYVRNSDNILDFFTKYMEKFNQILLNADINSSPPDYDEAISGFFKSLQQDNSDRDTIELIKYLQDNFRDKFITAIEKYCQTSSTNQKEDAEDFISEVFDDNKANFKKLAASVFFNLHLHTPAAYEHANNVGIIYAPENDHNWGVNVAWILGITERGIPLHILSPLNVENGYRHDANRNRLEGPQPSALALEISIAMKMGYSIEIDPQNSIILRAPATLALQNTNGVPGNGVLPTKEEQIRLYNQCVFAVEMQTLSNTQGFGMPLEQSGSTTRGDIRVSDAHAWKPRRSKRRACKPEGGARIFCSAR